MSDLISRADAIEAVCKAVCEDDVSIFPECDQIKYCDEIQALLALPSADAEPKWNCTATFVAEQLKRLRNMTDEEKWDFFIKFFSPSADAVHGWRIGKPTEQGKYMVTLDSFGYKHIDLFYYGKPMMPNRKVKGMCWYRSDDEWGDVVYDDKDILAWQPLPKPYKGGDTE